MVVGLRRDGERVEAGDGRFVVAEAGSCGDEVEDLDDLRAEAAGELALSPECVLAGDPPLFVGVVPSGRYVFPRSRW